MQLKTGILNCLLDDDESIEQIEQMLTEYEVSSSRDEIAIALIELCNQNQIEIAYPDLNQDSLNVENIEDYWFRLTELGKKELK